MATCEWVIDILQEWANARFLQPPAFINRGDPAAIDFSQADLTMDSTWRDMNLSGIVPAGAVGVVLRVRIRDNAVGRTIRFRRNGNVNEVNVAILYTQVANIFKFADMIVALDSNRFIEYFADPAVDSISIAVKAWWL